MMNEINTSIIRQFERHLKSEEKSKNTVEKYIRDVTFFAKYLCHGSINKETAISYKQELITKEYSVRSINSIIASLNSFLHL